MVYPYIQLYESNTGRQVEATHVVGIDESGQIGQGDTFVITAVCCPRTSVEELVEDMIEAGLSPWLKKSRDYYEAELKLKFNQSVAEFIKLIGQKNTISWVSLFSTDRIRPKTIAMSYCMASTKTISSLRYSVTEPASYAILIDGEEGTHVNGETLRNAAATKFSHSFEKQFGPSYPINLKYCDTRYPEIAAADYLSSYVRYLVETQSELNTNVHQIRHEWASQIEKKPLNVHKLTEFPVYADSEELSNFCSWVKGGKPVYPCASTGYRADSRLIGEVDSEILRCYANSL